MSNFLTSDTRKTNSTGDYLLNIMGSHGLSWGQLMKASCCFSALVTYTTTKRYVLKLTLNIYLFTDLLKYMQGA